MAFITFPLPLVLAGPLVRKATKMEVYFWLATSKNLSNPTVELYRHRVDWPELPSISHQETFMLGKRLYVTLFRAIPNKEKGLSDFPSDELIGYDISWNGGHQSLRDYMIERKTPITLGRLPFPTFKLQKSTERKLFALYGSCRKLHAHGRDMMRAVYKILRNRNQMRSRPSYLFLGGDQIYADDVADILIPIIQALGKELVGREEEIPEIGKVGNIGRRRRGVWLKKKARFTSGAMSNHLITFGEYAATHLLAWSPALWPDEFKSRNNVIKKQLLAIELLDGLRLQSGEAYRRFKIVRESFLGANAAQLALANIITYMTFDDHEITDDWYIVPPWKDAVLKTKPGRRVIANGLAAYWAFQGWGNDPDAFSHEFLEKMKKYFPDGQNPNEFEDALLGLNHQKPPSWTFIAPTFPPTLFLDIRTHRDQVKKVIFDRVDGKSIRRAPGNPRDQPSFASFGRQLLGSTLIGGARLLNKEERRQLRELLNKEIKTERYRKGSPLIIVSPTPVFGWERIEFFQEELIQRMALGRDAKDFENWAADTRSFMDFIDLVLEYEPKPLVILSGDVHYAFEVVVSVTTGKKKINIFQGCASAMKNKPSGPLEKFILDLLKVGQTNPNKRSVKTVGWVDHALSGMANKDGPIYRFQQTTPTLPAHLDFETNRSFALRKSPLFPEWPILRINNVGELQMNGGQIKHRFHFAKKNSFELDLPFIELDPQQWPV